MSTEAQNQTSIPAEYLLDPNDPANQPHKADPASPQAAPAPDDIPEQFRGKSAADLVKIIRDSQSELGRARNEIGTVRRLADELLGINRAVAATPKADNQPQRKPLTTDEILHDPERAVVEVVRAEADKREASSSERVARLEAELALSRFEQKHPNYREVVAKPEFAEWVQGSGLRTRLAVAAQQGDFAAADELLALYGEHQPAKREAAPSPVDQARNAGLVRPGASNSGSSSPKSNQIWSRAKLLDMRINNPEEFERLQPEILQAYKEKRVR